MYKITEYSKQKASQLGVQIKPSSNPKKKLDVFKNKNKIASIGDINSKDYPTYLKENKALSDERRRLYKLRHQKDRKVIGSNGYYADRILW